MEWIFVALLAIVAWVAIARRRVARNLKRLRPITADDIEPRNVPITREMAARAYAEFYDARYRATSGFEIDYAVEHLLNFISERIEVLETAREETRRRLKIAKRIQRDEKNDTETVSDDDYWSAPPFNDEPIADTVARRQARFDAQDREIDALKADVRPLLVDFLNEEVR